MIEKKVKRPGVKPFRLVTYGSAEKCFKEYDPNFSAKGHLEGFDEKGRPYRMTYRHALKLVKKGMRWGWTDRTNRVVHIWYDGRVSFGTLMLLLAHEVSHVFDTHNWHNQDREVFAGWCSESARCAYDVTKSLLKDRNAKIREYRKRVNQSTGTSLTS